MSDYAAMLRREARMLEERDGGGFQWLDEAAAEIERLRLALRKIYAEERRRHFLACPDCDRPDQCSAETGCMLVDQSVVQQIVRVALAGGGGDGD